MVVHNIKKRIMQAMMLLGVLFAGLLVPTTTTIVQNWQGIAQAANHNGVSGTCDWDVTNDILTIKPSNGVKGTLGTDRPWTEDAIKKDVIAVTIKPGVVANINASSMFAGLENCKTIDHLENLDVSRTKDFSAMFIDCRSLKSLDLSSFNTSNGKDMNFMFSTCSSLDSLDLSSFDTSNAEDMSHLFLECTSLQSVDVSKFNTKNVEFMAQMFAECPALKSLDVSKFDTKHVRDMSAMFSWCSALKSLDVSNFDMQSVQYASAMFYKCSSLQTLDVSKWNLYDAQQINGMFEDCSQLTSLDVSKWNTAKATDLGGIFAGCTGLTKIDVSRWDTSDVLSMQAMFRGCSNLKQIDVSGWVTNKVMNMMHLFKGCSSIEQLDLSKWDSKNAVFIEYSMFAGCSSLWKLILGPDFQLNYGTELPNPVVGTQFDRKYKTNSDKWRLVGNGDAHHPQGIERTAAQMVLHHNNSGISDTYVWQAAPLADVTVTVNYLDLDEPSLAKQIIDTENLTGEEDVSYKFSDTKLKALEALGYTFVKADNGYPNGVFSAATINVYMKHGVDSKSITKDIKQTIRYEDENGKQIAAVNVQSLHFTGVVHTDRVTGAVTVAWDLPTLETKAVDSPNINGWHADQTRIEAKKINANDADSTIVVTYSEDGSNGSNGSNGAVQTPRQARTPSPTSNMLQNPAVGSPATVGQNLGVVPFVAIPVVGIAPGQGIDGASATTPAKSKEVIATDDATTDNADEVADEQDEQETGGLPWLGGLLAAIVLGILGALWYWRDRWIAELETDGDGITHYFVNKWATLGYFDNYFDTRIRDFEVHKHAHLLNYLQQEHPDFKAGDTMQVGGFKITARGKNGQNIKFLEVVQIEK
ncbi:MAG: BspA family leucine-rich repeat surface protein [Lactobacillaceae bacterium]|jgi:surface protein|nr:BspA family leucine-rich repeat surface protein [Lactobacillaceae bacterium]